MINERSLVDLIPVFCVQILLVKYRHTIPVSIVSISL